MTAQGYTPYVTMKFIDIGTYFSRTSTREALVATSCPHSTMELSTYKSLYPKQYEADDENDHDYTLIVNPSKNYTLLSQKYIKTNYYLTTETKEVPFSSKFYIIQDTNQDSPDITLGTDTLFNPNLISSLTPKGLRLADSDHTLIHYSYIIKTPTPTRSMIYNLLSSERARVRSSPTSPFMHQRYQLEHPSTDEKRTQRSPNHSS